MDENSVFLSWWYILHRRNRARRNDRMSNGKLKHWASNNKLFLVVIAASACLLVATVVVVVSPRGVACKIYNNSKLSHNSTNDKQICHGYCRLSGNVEPKNYKLLLIPDISQKKFKGSVTITIEVLEPINKIILHSNKLGIHTVNLKTNDSQDISVTYQVMEDEKVLIIKSKRKIEESEYKLYLTFSGKLDNGIVGFYASNLKDGRMMVASKFQPTYARQAFPCFDEPEFKATYDITLAKPVNLKALSNMNEVSNIHDPETNLDFVTFATSVPMSTYLACFVICDFDSKSTIIDPGNIGSKFTLRTFAQKNELEKINFALDIATKATNFYIKYYEVPFPLPKLDMIAIPDYISGATEHWGLITYRETAFLIDDEHSSASNKIRVANTITHELAHMWFGNLVTMKWWDDVWLNEGFASYMQVKALDAIQPSWKVLDHFLSRTLHPVLVTDSRLTSHPIVQSVTTPDQITAIFDSISYNKGASILRMLEGFIGPEKFRRGVKDYLEKFKFGATVTKDLLLCLEPYFKEQHPDMNILDIMHSWTKQMGYPVLTVKPGDEPRSYLVSQSRFLMDQPHGNDTNLNYRWIVPITYRTAKGAKDKIIWLPDTDIKIKITLSEDEHWLKINNNQVGYYRVNYSLAMWNQLIEQLKSKPDQFTPADRAHLLNDAFSLAEARMLSYKLALNFTTYLTVEHDLVPWQTATTIYNNLENKLLNSLAYDNLQKYFQRLILPIYEKQDWDAKNLPVMESLLRTEILELAARCQLLDAEQRIRTLFSNWLEKKDTKEEISIHQDLRSIVYFYGMKYATSREWDRLFQIYLKEDDVQEKSKLRSALSAPRDTTLLRKLMLLSWDERHVRGQDYLVVLADVAANPSGAALAWDVARAHWPKLVARFTLNSRYLASALLALTHTFDTRLKYSEMETFFKENPEAGAGELARKRALETVTSNIRWNLYNLNPVTNWLSTNA